MSDSPTSSTTTRKPRKKTESIDDSNPSNSKPTSSIPHTVSTGKVPGPPYTCPSCHTTYSRLEYLRRHERRHADIRPFVCECGKGFSRSDVLKRHRRQCASVPEEDAEALNKKGPGRAKKAAPAAAATGEGGASSSTPKKRKAKPKKDEDIENEEDEIQSEKEDSPPPNKRNTGPGGIQKQSHQAQPQQSQQKQQLHQAQQQQQQQHQQQNHQQQQQPQQPAAYAQWSGANQTALPANLTHAYQGQGRESDYGGQKPPPPIHAYMQSGGPPPLHAQISSLSQFHSNQGGNNYPSSPESNASAVSPHTSPRNSHRDISRTVNGVQGGTGMIRYGSGSSLREQIASGSGRATPPPPTSASGSRHAYPGPEFWNAIDPSLEGGRSNGNNNKSNKRNAKGNGKSNDASNENGDADALNNSNRNGNSDILFNSNARGGAGGIGMSGYPSQSVGGGGSGGPAFSFPSSAEQFGGAASSSQNPSSLPSRSNHPTFESGSVGGGTSLTSREPQRFSFSTGPLSPFSNAALSSSTSPYLSAFSNARDTPLVSSPRGSTSGAPGTPGGSSGNNSFDWSMRPPNKPPNRSSTGGTVGTPGTIANQVISNSGGISNDTPTKKGLQAKRLSVGSTSLSTTSGVTSAGIAAPLLAGVTSSSSNGGTHTPSRFVSRSIGGSQPTNYFDFSSEGSSGNVAASVTPSSGPDAFLMSALNGGGISDSRINANEHQNSSNSLSNNLPSSGVNMAALFGLNSNGHMTTPATPLWDFANMSSGQTSVGLSGNGTTPSFGLTGSLTNSNQNSSLGWLMSPSIQQLLNSFSEPQGSNASPSPRPALPTHDSYFPPQRPLTESQVAAGLDDDPNFQAILSSQTEGTDASNSTSTVTNTNTTANNGSATSSSTNAAVSSSGVGVATPGGTGSLALERAFKDIANPFFIPPTLFRSCYAIAHWALPPLTRLSMLALHSQQNLLKHFPIMHEPTFRLDTTPGCLAFATCMMGAHEPGRKWWAGEEVVARSPSAFPTINPNPSKDPNASNLLDEEDGQELIKPVVMGEKMEMLIKSFSTKCRALKDKVSVVQSTMLWQANNLLSSDENVRSSAANGIGEIIGLARQGGLFDPDSPHVSRSITYTPDEVLKNAISESSELAFSFSFLPSYLPGCRDEEKLWRTWSEYEGRRRTCHSLWILDTVSALDEDIAIQISFDEFKHLPLPSPDSIWRTSTVNSWRSALDEYKGPTIEQAVIELFSGKNVKSPKSNDEASPKNSKSNPETNGSNSSQVNGENSSSIFGSHGPFARTVLIITILRGMLQMIDSKNRKEGDRSSFMDQYIDKDQKFSPPPGAAPIENKELSAQVSAYRGALALWRKAWDQDKLCREASGPNFRINPFSPSRLAPGNENEVKFKSVTASGAVPLCDDALPFYWLAHVLLGHVANNKKLPSRSVKSSTSNGSDTRSNGESKKEVADFRSMLRFAKQFVLNGEGQNQTISTAGAASK